MFLYGGERMDDSGFKKKIFTRVMGTVSSVLFYVQPERERERESFW